MSHRVRTSRYIAWVQHVYHERYSSCRYNERQLIDVTVVRRVRPWAEHNVRTYRFLPADTRYIRIWYIIRTWYHTKTKISRTHAQIFSPLKPRLEHTHSFFFLDVW